MPTVSDNFNRANETPIGSPWASSIGGGANLTNNALTSIASGERLSFYTGTFVADQESYGTVGNLVSNSQYAELAVRMDANGNAFVLFTDGDSGAGHTEFGVFANGSYSTLAGVATTFANGNRMRLTVSGASPNITLTAYKDTGGGWVQVGQITGVSGPNSGNPGAGAYGTATIDDWTGTDGQGTATIEQKGFRFGQDAAESSPTWHAAQDSNVTLPADQNVYLAVALDFSRNPGAKVYKLQYRKVGEGTWQDVPVQ